MRIKDITSNFVISEDEQPTGRYDVNSDSKKPQMGDTRKPQLTLRNINKLKKIRATKEVEMAQKKELLGVMYGQRGGEEDGI